MARFSKGIRDLPFVRGVRLVASRCAAIVERVLIGSGHPGADVPQTLKVEVVSVRFDGAPGDTHHGQCRISVANLSVTLVERLALSLTITQDGIGALYSVEHTYDVHIEPGDFVEVDLDLGKVPLDDSQAGLTTEVHVCASRHVNKKVPTYVLPDSATGVCTIEEAFALARDIAVERIDISLSRNLLRNRGWARVMFVIRNDGGIVHNNLSLVTRFYSISGELLGEARDTFTMVALGQTRVTSKVTLRQVRGLGATRFEAEIDGFEELARGAASYRGVDGPSTTSETRPETWEGEEVKGAYWINRPLS